MTNGALAKIEVTVLKRQNKGTMPKGMVPLLFIRGK